MPIESGSSPLARGTSTVFTARFSGPGLIPARAGNMAIGSRMGSRHWAHPRSRGEHTEALVGTIDA